MKQIIKKAKYLTVLIFFGFILSLTFAPITTSADSLFSGAKKEACKGTQIGGSGGGECSDACLNPSGAVANSCSSSKLSSTVKKGLDFLSVVVGVISVVVIIIGGIRYIVSDGDSAKINTARSTIIYALVGLVLVAFAQIIVKLVLTKVG